MDGFTPTFFLQVLIAVASAGAVYGAVKTDLKNMHRRMDDEQRLREMHSKEDDDSFHDIRNEMGIIGNRVSVIEGGMKR